ncbi:MAG TPA: formimidoylglutamate deiminase [Burkholderiales bacterium]|nr:formimidoylglutamate deiminase [Burkholderiales bacterium]
MKAWFCDQALLAEGWVRDVRIEVDERGDIASVAALASPAGAERLAGPVLPGMANVHSHAFQRAMAGLAEVRGDSEDDFWTWREAMYRFVSRLEPQDAQAIATHLYVEMLRHGYTGVAEFHYVHNDASGAPYAEPAQMLLSHLAAASAAGIAITLLPGLYQWSNFGRRALEPRQKRFRSDVATVLSMIDAVRRASPGDRNVRAGAAPHSLRAVDLPELQELDAALRAEDPSAPIHIHVAEQTREVDECLAWSGKRPLELLLETVPIDARWCIVHATHMNAAETRALAESNAVAGFCPSTEANLGDGIPPLLEYRAAGGRYAIGGDSHVSRNPAEELRLLEYGQRLSHRRRNLVLGSTTKAVGTALWLAAARGGAQALGRASGAIAANCRADLVVLDPAHPDLAGRDADAISNALVFSGGDRMVRDVMVGGKWQVREGHHPLQARAADDYLRAIKRLPG